MSKDELHLAAAGQKHAFIRDGALILYFDKAETPFVARFDLDSLAQANFEVADKKDGFYYLTLRDYTGDAQVIGQFGSKNDAHQALYLILQALLEQPVGSLVVESSKGNIFWRILKAILKFLLILALAVAVLYVLVRLPLFYSKGTTPVAAVSEPITTDDISALPEGEAFDADKLLGNGTTNTAPAQEPSVTEQPAAPAEEVAPSDTTEAPQEKPTEQAPTE